MPNLLWILTYNIHLCCTSTSRAGPHGSQHTAAHGAAPHLRRHQSPRRPGSPSFPACQKCQETRATSLLTLSRSAPASMSTTAASPCPLSIARCRGVMPARSRVLRRVLGRPSGGRRRMLRNATLPVVAARCSGCWLARSLALIWVSAASGYHELTSAPRPMRRRPICELVLSNRIPPTEVLPFEAA